MRRAERLAKFREARDRIQRMNAEAKKPRATEPETRKSDFRGTK